VDFQMDIPLQNLLPLTCPLTHPCCPLGSLNGVWPWDTCVFCSLDRPPGFQVRVQWAVGEDADTWLHFLGALSESAQSKMLSATGGPCAGTDLSWLGPSCLLLE
jgi:hypothetical protein